MSKVQAVFYANPNRYPPVINSVRLLSQSGFATQLICRDKGPRWNASYPEGTRFRWIRSSRMSAWAQYVFFVSAALLLSDHRTAVFVGHDMHGLLPAFLLSRLHRRPLIYHCHELVTSDGLRFGGRMIYLFQKLFAKFADVVIVPDGNRAEIIRDTCRLRRTPNVVTNAPLKASVPSTSLLQQELRARGAEFGRVLLRQSSIGPGHSIEATIRSIRLWRRPDWGFAVIGPGNDEYLRGLYRFAAECKVGDRFVVLPAVDYDQILSFTVGVDVGHALYDAVDANSRFSTTASNKLFEYMAAGIPVLVSDRPGLRDLVERHRCGVVADESSPESIAAAVNDLLGNPERARNMGESGRRAFEEEFCYERQFAPVLRVIRDLCVRHM
jgi:glycosyltransferase involved in cell wall biosynthesis